MDNRCIGVFDSGVGGLSVLKMLADYFKEESFVYLGDNKNVPYGSRDKTEIVGLVKDNLNALLGYGVKAVILACNTASVSFSEAEFSGVPIFKLTPSLPVDRLRGKRGCFIGTPATVKALEFSHCFNGVNLTFIPMPTLAEEIEKKLAFGENRVLVDHLLTTVKHFDFIYLGCTHYLHLKDAFCAYFGTENVFDGVNILIENIENYLENTNKTANNIQTIDFVGCFGELNERIYRSFSR